MGHTLGFKYGLLTKQASDSGMDVVAQPTLWLAQQVHLYMLKFICISRIMLPVVVWNEAHFTSNPGPKSLIYQHNQLNCYSPASYVDLTIRVWFYEIALLLWLLIPEPRCFNSLMGQVECPPRWDGSSQGSKSPLDSIPGPGHVTQAYDSDHISPSDYHP